MPVLCAPTNVPQRKKLRGRSFRRPNPGGAASSSTLTTRVLPNGTQRTVLALNRGRLDGIAVQATADMATLLPSPTLLRRKQSRVIRMVASRRRSSLCSQASEGAASVSSITARLQRLEAEYESTQRSSVEKQDSLKSFPSMAAALGPIMLGARILTGTNDVAATVGPALGAISENVQVEFSQVHNKSQAGLAVGMHALGMQAPQLQEAPSLTTAASVGAGAVGAMGASHMAASAFMDAKTADALASMLQANTTSSEGLSTKDSADPNHPIVPQAPNPQPNHSSATPPTHKTVDLQSLTRGGGAVLMRVESLKKRMQRNVAKGLGKLWVAWHQEGEETYDTQQHHQQDQDAYDDGHLWQPLQPNGSSGMHLLEPAAAGVSV